MKTKTFVSLCLLLAISLAFFSSCNKVKDLATFDVTYNLPSIPFTYTPVTLKSGEVILYSGSYSINLDSLLNAHGYSSGLIENTEFSYIGITITEPETANFNWLYTGSVVVSQTPTFDSSAVVGTVVNDTTTGSKSITLTMNNVNIRPYLNTSQFYFRILAQTNGPVPYSWIMMYINSQLKLTISPL